MKGIKIGTQLVRAEKKCEQSKQINANKGLRTYYVFKLESDKCIECPLF